MAMFPKFHRGLAIVLLWVLLFLSFILSPPAIAEEALKIGGTGNALSLMELVGKGFEMVNQGVKVKVITPSLGSGGGIKAVSKGAIDIGLSSRLLMEEELKLGLSSIKTSKTPLVFVTKEDVNISGLKAGEIAKIYRGETTAWPDGKRIRLVLRPKTDTDTLLVKKISPEMSHAVDAAMSKKGLAIAMTDQDCLDLLEKTLGGFTVSTLAQIISEKRPLKILSFNGVKPSIQALADGSYPLFKELYLVTKTEPSGVVRKFIDFVQSPPGMKIMEGTGILVIMGKPGK
jgi:phosphate transport system substrate-binding protein